MGLKIYKRSQGYHTRLWSGLILFAISALGCYILHGRLRAYFGDKIWVYTFIPAGVCALLGLFIYWLLNKPGVADFMIAAEGEMKKVSWSSRKEIVASTMIVIVVVVIMAILLLCTDFIFRFLFTEVFKIYN